jgi:hypothetical protein
MRAGAHERLPVGAVLHGRLLLQKREENEGRMLVRNEGRWLLEGICRCSPGFGS